MSLKTWMATSLALMCPLVALPLTMANPTGTRAKPARPTIVKTAPAPKSFPLGLSTYGPMQIGMTVPQAGKALGLKLAPKYGLKPNKDCYYVSPTDPNWAKVNMMVSGYRISRVEPDDIFTRTTEGARIGLTEAQLKKIYPAIQSEPHKYDPKGRVFVYDSPDPKKRAYQMRFETDGKKVTRFRSGFKTQVTWVEGCS